MATKKMTMVITKNEFDFMNQRETNLYRYGRFLADQVKPTDTFAFYLPEIAEDSGSYSFAWECEDIILENELISVGTVADTALANGTSLADIIAMLPATVVLKVGGAGGTVKDVNGSVTWNESPSPAYDPTSTAAQDIVFTGLVVLPEGITNPSSLSLSVTATFNVAAKILESITVTTNPTKLAYTAGETFDPTGLVIKATYNDGEETVAYADHVADFGFTPTLETPLSAGEELVTVLYGGKAAEIEITVA